MKNILITGATSGIGKATALLLEKKGYHSILVGRNENKLKEMCDSAREMEYIVYDLNDLYHIEEIFKELQKRNIILDGFVHSAGVSPLMKVADNDVQAMEETFRINYFCFLEIMKYFQKEGMYHKGASVVALSSVIARIASYRQTLYGSSKAALEEGVRCLAKELVEKDIRVNCIAPGAVKTEMVTELAKKSNNLLEKMNKNFPLGLLEPENVAETIEIMLTDKSKYMTGDVIQLDAGFWIWK